MALTPTVKTAPSIRPIDLADLKAQARITSSAEDSLIEGMIKAATNNAEEFTRRAFITRTLEVRLDAWPADGIIRLPLPPLQSVTSIKYLDTAGDEQTLDSAAYRVDIYSHPARITPAYGYTWPALRDVINAITIEFVTGYGDEVTDVPEDLRHAIRLLAAHYFDERSATSTEAPKTVPLTYARLLYPFRVDLIA